MVILNPGLDLPYLARRSPYWVAQWFLIMIPSALVLVATRKSSLIRIAWIPCCLVLLHSILKDLLSCSEALAVRTVLGGMFLVETQHLLSILIVVWPDSEQLEQGNVYHSRDSFLLKVMHTVGFFYNMRGLGTAWQIKRINSHPRSLLTSDKNGKSGKPGRGQFITRQLAIISWQWLLLDLLYEGALGQSKEQKLAMIGTHLEFVYRGLSLEQWTYRFIAGFCSWMVPSRLFIDIVFRLAGVVSVASGMHEPQSWPPSFGTVADAYSIRSFWSKTWHQYLRRPLTTVSNFVTRKLLRLQRPSIIERYLNITIVFLLSGVAHAVAAWYDPAYPQSAYLPTIAFFLASAIGIMLEDAVQATWRWVSGSGARAEGEPVPAWHKGVGLVWLAAWFTLTGPWMIYPPARFDSEYSWFVPARVVPCLGTPVTIAVLGLGALMLTFVFGASI